jgi:shikimate kinase
MRGESITFGAISIVNGIPNGIGAAAGIKLKVHVKAETIEDNIVKSSIKINDNIAVDDKLIKAAFNVLKNAFNIQNGLYKYIISEIPNSSCC